MAILKSSITFGLMFFVLLGMASAMTIIPLDGTSETEPYTVNMTFNASWEWTSSPVDCCYKIDEEIPEGFDFIFCMVGTVIPGHGELPGGPGHPPIPAVNSTWYYEAEQTFSAGNHIIRSACKTAPSYVEVRDYGESNIMITSPSPSPLTGYGILNGIGTCTESDWTPFLIFAILALVFFSIAVQTFNGTKVMVKVMPILLMLFGITIILIWLVGC